MLDFIYYNPVKLICGESKMDEVISEVKSFGEKVLLVFGGHSFKENGYYDPFVKALEENGIQYYEMGGNKIPSLKKVREGIQLCKAEKIDCVLGIGGGTCMDIAKTIAFGVKQPHDIWEYLTYAREADTNEHLPVGTIVTYPSSGSDMDGATQITNDETKEQAGLSGVFPNFAWLNPAYMMSIDNDGLKWAQITSFVQVSIAYLGLERSELAEKMALVLMESILSNLERSLAAPDNKEARRTLMLTSALNVNGLTSIGKQGDWSMYPIEGIVQNYYGISYKPAITILFPYWIKHIYGGQNVFKDYFQQVFHIKVQDKNDCEILNEGLQELLKLYRKFDIPTSFGEIKSHEENLPVLRQMISQIGEQPSMYTEFTEEKIEALILDAITGKIK